MIKWLNLKSFIFSVTSSDEEESRSTCDFEQNVILLFKREKCELKAPPCNVMCISTAKLSQEKSSAHLTNQ